ncbi:hypothetical protein QOT17_005046 [Balamuthia mandrillaris]
MVSLRLTKCRLHCSLSTLFVLLYFASYGLSQDCSRVSELEGNITSPCNLLLSSNDSISSALSDSASEWLRLLAIADTNCQNAGATFICAFFFTKCVSTTTNDDQQLVLPSRPCRSLCLNFFAACGELLSSSSDIVLPFTCDAFPENVTTSTNGTEVSCFTMAFTSEQEKDLYPVTPCPPELAEKDGMCVFPCPYPVWTDEQYDAADGISTTFWLCSFVATTFFLLTQIGRGIVKKKSPLYQNAFWVVFSGFLFSLNGLWAIFVGWDNLRCDDRSTPNETKCKAWAFFFTYFALTVCAWFFITTLNMMLCIILQKAEMDRRVTIIYHVCGWLLPLLSPIILISVDKLGYDGLPWCVPTSDDVSDPETTLYWAWTLFYLPITLIAVLVVSFIFVVVFWIWKWTKFEGLRRQWRTVAMGVGLTVVFTFCVGFFYHRWYESDAVADATYDFYGCILSRAPDDDTPCEIENPLSFGMLLMVLWAAASGGAISTLLLGTRWGDFQFWYRGVLNLMERKSFFDQRKTRTSPVGVASNPSVTSTDIPLDSSDEEN